MHERISWIHVLRTHVSLSAGKVKATKREMSLLNSSLYQLARSGASIATPQGGGSSSSTGVDDDEERPDDAAVGAPGVATRAVAQILRSRLHDVRRNPNKGADELDFSPAIAAGADAIQQLPQLFPDAYWNNLAILSAHKGKSTRSVLAQFLQAASVSQRQNAVSSSSSSSGSNDAASAGSDWNQQLLSNTAQESTPEIMYNTAVILMQMGRYAEALACFEAAALQSPAAIGSPSFPMLGLRLAECHVQVYNSKRTASFDSSKDKAAPPLYYQPGATVRIEKLINIEADVSAHISTAKAKLVEYIHISDTVPQAPHPYVRAYVSFACRLPFLLSRYKDYFLKLYSRVLLAYTELEVGNYVVAKEVAQQAIDLPRVSPSLPSSASTAAGSDASQQTSYESHISSYLLCAHLYLSEALLRLRSAVEAEKLLQYASTNFAIDLGGDLKHVGKCALAAAWLAQGKLESARKVLDAADAEAPGLRYAAVLRVWMQLKEKDFDGAVALLKRLKLPPDYRVSTQQTKSDPPK